MTAIKPLLGVLVAALIAFGLQSYLAGAETYWLQIAILCGAFMLCPGWLVADTRYFLLAALLASVVAAGSALLTPHFVLSAGFLFLITLVTAYTAVSCGVFLSLALLISYFAYLGAAFPVGFAGAEQRIGWAVLGFGLALVISKVFFRTDSKAYALSSMATCLDKLSQLNNTIFILFQQQDYHEHIFFYEKKLHKAQREYWYCVLRARQACQQASHKYNVLLNQLLGKIEQIYELLNALGLLLQRIEDHSTFEAGNKEFTSLNNTLSKQLENLARAMRHPGSLPALKAEELPGIIHDLEEVNRNAFQVVVYDPLVIALFIHDLHWLHEVLQALSLLTAKPTVAHE